jgi:hypothetical protein
MNIIFSIIQEDTLCHIASSFCPSSSGRKQGTNASLDVAGLGER